MQPQELAISQFLLRLGVGAGCGLAIGFERQWRQRNVGLHTSTLVATGAALFTLLEPLLGVSNSQRVIANVVTGVGFLAGGVIFRSGANVSGLNNAATIWATAAIGALCGQGLLAEAAIGAAAITCLNVLLVPLSAAIDARTQNEDG